MLKTFLIGTSLFYLFLPFAVCAAGPPKVGDKPPLMQATELLQAPPGAKMDAESLRGKVVVLEFWATWCGPCVGAIPHLNELADKFRNKPVQFIAITAEDQNTITNFLAKRPIHAWIALDASNAMNKAYHVTGIPHTVVLGKDGKIAAITYPTMFTAKDIGDLLRGRKIKLAESGGYTVAAGKPPGSDNQKPPLFQVLIQPSIYTNAQGAGWGNGSMNAEGYTVQGILPSVFGVNSDRFVTNTALPSGLFDFIVKQGARSKTREDENALLQEAIKSAFGLTGRRETNEMNVWALKAVATNAPGLIPSPTRDMSYSTRPGAMEGVGVSMPALASFLETVLKTPVVDETGLTNDYGYDVSLKWKQKSWSDPNPEDFKKALREQLGLELVPDRQPVEMVVIEKAKF
jgi:uncharacterized protein (TIGR03435 family)